MKEFIQIFKNWHNIVLFLLFALVLVLLFGVCDSIPLLLASKAACIVCAFIFAKLYKYWWKKDEISEITRLGKEE